jgi:hypothetical protein
LATSQNKVSWSHYANCFYLQNFTLWIFNELVTINDCEISKVKFFNFLNKLMIILNFAMFYPLTHSFNHSFCVKLIKIPVQAYSRFSFRAFSLKEIAIQYNLLRKVHKTWNIGWKWASERDGRRSCKNFYYQNNSFLWLNKK